MCRSMKSDIPSALHLSLAAAVLHLQGAATPSLSAAAPSSACCRSPVHPPPLAVPTVKGDVAYSAEFINLFAAPTGNHWK